MNRKTKTTLTTSILAAIAAAAMLAGCSSHSSATPGTAKAGTNQTATTAQTSAKAEEYKSSLAAELAIFANDALARTADGSVAGAMIGVPAGTIVTMTAGRVVRTSVDTNMSWWCKRYAADRNVSVGACSIPRVVLEISPCIRADCPHTDGAFAVVVSPKNAPKLGDVVTILQEPSGGGALVINDGYFDGR